MKNETDKQKLKRLEGRLFYLEQKIYQMELTMSLIGKGEVKEYTPSIVPIPEIHLEVNPDGHISNLLDKKIEFEEDE